MSDADTARLTIAGIYLLPALVWGSIGVVAAGITLRRQPDDAIIRLATGVTALLTIYYLTGLLLALRDDPLPGPSPASPVGLRILRDLIAVAALAIGPHLIPLSTVRGEKPSRRWVTVNYAAALAVAILIVAVTVLPATPAPLRWWWSRLVLLGYVFVTSAVNVWQLRRLARPGRWSSGTLGELRHSDVTWHVGGLVALLLLGAVLWAKGSSGTLLTTIVEVGIGLAGAVPFAVRFLAEGGRVFLSGLALLAAAAGGHLAARKLTPAAGIGRDAVTVLITALVLGPTWAWLRGGIDGFVFRRSRRRRRELQRILERLTPEVGAVECCRQGLAQALPVMQLRGAAILLHDGEAVVAGDFALDRIRPVWPRGEAAAALPSRAFGGPSFRVLPLPLREAIIDAGVVGVLPIVSPRRRWGDLLAAAGMLTAIYSDEDVQTWEGFAAQLALVLDAADLIARAVAVERSLAHAEKLAAIGEVSARIAHEIRNPVTAARSLAQQLAREPGAPFAAEHGLILVELERVERQVAALLRFARRDEYRFETVRLGELARGTIAALQPRLEAAGIVVTLDVTADSTARADREKLRQVLVNLLENAIDALGERAGERRLAVAVAGANGTVTLRVADNGPGIPAAALAHVLEPFFTLKPGGTGLGLAIAHRTVEMHGGHLELAAAPEGGLAVTVALPALEGRA